MNLPFRPEEDVRFPRKKDADVQKIGVKYERDVKHYSIHSLTDDIFKMIDEEAQAHVRRTAREWPFGHKLASRRSSTTVGNEVVTNIKWYFVEDKAFYHPKSI